jgi:uncharacterized protein Usg
MYWGPTSSNQLTSSRMPLIIKQPVVLRVHYWMPDYNNLLQEFMWQFLDVVPEYPRTHLFLNYWKDNIEAVIHTVEIS